MKNNPKKDVVAGRTAYQIETAKRNAVKTGKRKRCKAGKSCGATCIQRGKVCMVDLPWVVSSGLKKVSFSIQRSKVSYTKDYPRLSSLKTPKEFEDKLKGSEAFYNSSVERAHTEMQRILGKSNGMYSPIYRDRDEEVKYSLVRRKVEKELGNTSLDDAYKALKRFTGSFHKEIRDAQRGIILPQHQHIKDKLDKWTKDLEKLLSVSGLPRPEIEKFRGIRTTPEHLAKLIESSKKQSVLPASAAASWSSSLRIARDFANIKKDPSQTERVIFRTINKTGVPVESVSSIEEEYEFLTTKNSKYRYTGYAPVQYMGTTYHIFDLTEADA